MLDTTVFDISYQDRITQITKIESDEQEETESNTTNTFETEISLPASPEDLVASAYSGLSEVGAPIHEIPISVAPGAKEISATLDTANILPEGVSRMITQKHIWHGIRKF